MAITFPGEYFVGKSVSLNFYFVLVNFIIKKKSFSSIGQSPCTCKYSVGTKLDDKIKVEVGCGPCGKLCVIQNKCSFLCIYSEHYLLTVDFIKKKNLQVLVDLLALLNVLWELNWMIKLKLKSDVASFV